MNPTDASRAGPVTRSRSRPVAWSPGTVALAAAWVAAGAVARLTGAPAVIAVMVALAVGAVLDAITGWLVVRQPVVHGIVGPDVVDVDVEARIAIDIALPAARRVRRLVVVDVTTGEVVGAGDDRIDDDRLRVRTEGPGSDDHVDHVVVTCRFERPGVIDTLRIDVEAVGALGLLWWRRSSTVSGSRIHVAPLAAGTLVDVDSSPTTLDGPAATRRGIHHGDVDGVRPWRDGEPVVAVHWPSSLRSGSLIVHDRSASSEQRWTVEVSSLPDPPGARLRATIDEGLRRGHRVTIVDASGAPSDVTTDDEAARWAAEVESSRDTAAAPDRVPFWRRPLGGHRRRVEPDSAVPVRARWAAALAAFCALTTLVGGLTWSNTLVLAIGVAIAGGAVVSLQIARRAGRRPLALQVAIVVAIVAALTAIALDARDVDGLVAALRGPMPDLLMLLVVLHGFEVVDRRTLRVHQAITLAVAAYAAGLRIDDALGWWLGAWTVAFFASLWLTPGRRHTGRRRTTIGSAVGSTIRPIAWVAGALIATVAVASVVPIPDGPASLGLPALSNDAPSATAPGALVGPDGSAPPGDAATTPERGVIGDVVGYPGFTETLDTSVRGELGDQVVMRVRSPEPAFWRGQTFTEFDGRTWRVSPELGVRQDGPVIDVAPTLGDTDGRYTPTEELVQTYYVETDLPNLVFAAQRPRRVIFDGSLWTRPDGALRSDVTLTAGSVYTVVSERAQVTASVLRAQGDVGELFAGLRELPGSSVIDPFLELPASTTRRTIELATRLRTPGESTYDTIRAYEAWLAANTEYDLDAPVPAGGDDAVDDFLFESRRGFCEQIASTLAIMLRTQGVPTRLATGYVAGERDRVSGVWKVRARDAHAWVEVWFPQTGWQAFDPTANVPLAGDVERGTVGGDLVAAATAWTSAHRVEVATLAAAAVAVWAAALALRAMRRRRRRGRWGLLQDRFTALDTVVAADPPTDESTGAPIVHRAVAPTNPAIAVRLRAGGRRPDAEPVARVLDRAAFDPTWVDDDRLYERTRATIAELERSVR